jgi:hypothetical protein
MGNGGHDFAAAAGGKVGEDKVDDSSTDIGESVAIEEKEWRAAMALPQKFYGFCEGTDFGLEFAPLCFNRRIAL